uniref:Squalestatin tetraketide synthase n=1 Tax=Phoma sp. (strain C2932) TaxID=86977 RepID=SQTKS_PHOSC|nr:RecName: Full=Squalestatin tetraketide synthase; Short=SQTKS; AltName: Full=Highly reducing polyketide synthase 1; Short=HR-PKS 1; AltName: Full=Squalestatin S1 biosynthesis cluster protein pks1 [Phoma sp. C2932]AAO62426.1 type I polyketide synthase [Phoma sp. C2932]
MVPYYQPASSCGSNTMAAMDEHQHNEDATIPIAIIGMSCRFPGNATSPEKLWELCAQGRSAWSSIPKSRFRQEGFYNPNAERVGTSHVVGGHFLEEDPSLFDASFFNLSAEAAKTMDPQFRLQLESVYEAMESAGITLEHIAGSDTSVYAGACFRDYHDSLVRDPDLVPRFLLTGNGAAMSSNRVSHFYDLRGASMTVDTGCSTTLTALHLACQGLRNRESKTSIVTGANVILNPDMFVTMSSLGLLGPEGKSHTFDARANGYGRGEGIATVIIKRLDDALRAQDPIRCIIRGTALNQDGRTATLTSPSQTAQSDLIRACYRAAALDPNDTAFLAAHGTGTRTGDAVEIAAAADVFGEKRSPERPLWIGSVKTNIGHSEATSGLASVIQAALALEKGLIPPNINFKEPNEKLGQVSAAVRVPSNLQKWPSVSGVRRASVNNFGYGGANAHVILESGIPGHTPIANGSGRSNGTGNGHNGANGTTNGHNGTNGTTNGHFDATQATNGHYGTDETPDYAPLDSFVISISAKEEASARSMVTNLADYLRTLQVQDETKHFKSIAHTLGSHRSMFKWTAAKSITGPEELIAAAEGGQFQASRALERTRLGFVFTGQGAQWFAMGRELINTYPVFRQSLDRADRYLKEFGCEWSIIDELSRDAENSNVNDMTLSPPLCTAVQISLVQLLESWGIVPTAVTGHSSGEIAAAYAAGALDFKSAMAVTYFRGEVGLACQDKIVGKGGMIAVGLGPEDAEDRIARVQSGKIVVACINSQSSVTVSGDLSGIVELEDLLKAEGVFARRVKVQAAYHSHHMQVIANGYLTSLKDMLKPTKKFGKIIYSSPTTGRRETNAKLMASAQHWVNNMLSPVRFAESFQNMCFSNRNSSQSEEIFQDVDIVLEVGPHGMLQGPIQQMMSLPIFERARLPYISCLLRGQSAVHTMQTVAAGLMGWGYRVDMVAVNFPQGTYGVKILHDLPSYPWNHDNSHWWEPRLNKAHRQRVHPPHDLLGSLIVGRDLREPTWRHFIRVQDIPWIRDHVVQSALVYPGAGFICMAMEAMVQLHELRDSQSRKVAGYRLAEVDILRAMLIPDTSEGLEAHISLRPCSTKLLLTNEWYDFCVSSVGDDDKFVDHCRGRITIEFDTSGSADTPRTSLRERSRSTGLMRSVDPSNLYSFLRAQGIYHGPIFQNLKTISSRKDHSESSFVVANTASVMPNGFQSPHVIHPTTLDSIFQGAYTALPGAGLDQNTAMIPRSIQELYLSSALTSDVGQCLVSDTSLIRYDGQSFTVNVDVSSKADSEHTPVLEIKGLRNQSVGQMAPQPGDSSNNDLCFKLDWAPDISSVKQERLKEKFGFPLDPTEADIIMGLRQACIHFIHRSLQSLTAPDRDQLDWHQKRFYDWMVLQIQLAEEDRLAPNSSAWLQCSSSDEQKLLENVRASSVNGQMVVHVGKSMLAILRHEIAPLELMLQDKLLYRYYTDAIKWDRSYQQIDQLVKLHAHKCPTAKIIEIGAGTGGCTRAVLDALSNQGIARCAQYDFTDVSSGFFEAAQQKFAAFDDVIRFQKLDIEKDIEMQGFECGSYDLVIASQVLHATGKMEHTMANVRKLLKPGGKLLLVETTRDEMDLQLVFGLLPGWWLSSEEERQMSPSLSTNSWEKVLKKTGFDGLDIELRDCDSDEFYSFSVMMATASSTIASSSMAFAIVYGEVPLPDQFLDDMKTAISSSAVSDPVVGHLDSIDATGKFCIFIEDPETDILSSPDEKSYASIQKLVTRCKGLIWVSRGGAMHGTRPNSSLKTGLLRTLRLEYTEKRFISLDLDSARPQWNHDSITTINEVLCGALAQNADSSIKDSEFAEQDGQLFVPRISCDIARNEDLSSDSNSPAQMEPFHQPGKLLQMGIKTPGLIDTLQFSKTDATDNLPNDYIEIEPKAFGLNFRDVMVAMGQLEESIMGFECAGVVRRVGPSSAGHNIKVGDRVCALLGGQWTNTVRVHWHSVAPIPQAMDWETAASIPIVFVTAYISLVKIARMQAGETVLIHAASGGVGQAAIILAKHVGAEIFATVGTDEKRDLLIKEYKIPDDHIFSSRNALFAKSIRQRTNGKGVDVVLNCLAGGLLQESFDCLADFGRFIEIGKRDIELNHCLNMGMFARSATFTAVDLIAIGRDRSYMFAEALPKIMTLLQEKAIRPVTPISIYKIGDIETAFRLMQAGKHMGKIVITAPEDAMVPVITRPPKLQLRPDASYLIVGGLGGIGRSLCKNFVENGARSLVLLSRNANVSQQSGEFLDELRSTGCIVGVVDCDISSKTQVEATMLRLKKDMLPIRGIVHAGMVLQDSVFERMSLDDYNTAIRPKVQGSWNLHSGLSDCDLDFFIMLSSLAGVSGSASQANYTAGGAYQDALAKYRRAQGLSAVSIDLGMVQSVGYVAETKGVAERLVRMGYSPISEMEVLKIVEHAITNPPPEASSAQIITGISTKPGRHWTESSWLQDARFATLRERARDVKELSNSQGGAQDKQLAAGQELSMATSLVEAIDVVGRAITAKLATMFLIAAESIIASKSLSEYGVDSLVAVELRNWLAAQLSSDVSVFDVTQSQSLTALATTVATKSSRIDKSLLVA